MLFIGLKKKKRVDILAFVNKLEKCVGRATVDLKSFSNNQVQGRWGHFCKRVKGLSTYLFQESGNQKYFFQDYWKENFSGIRYSPIFVPGIRFSRIALPGIQDFFLESQLLPLPIIDRMSSVRLFITTKLTLPNVYRFFRNFTGLTRKNINILFRYL